MKERLKSTARASAAPQHPEIDRPRELSDAMRALTSISDNLLASYAALSERAQRVEKELVRTNAELQNKVAELDALRAHLEAILQALPTGVVVRDAEERIVRINDAASSILESEPQALLGRTSHALLAGREARGENREILRTDGRRSVIAARWSPIAGPRGEIAGSVEILDDRTELAQLTERVHNLDKMAALGSMAAGIAHEIRNPLNAVGGFAELLKQRVPAGSREERFAERICEGVHEADAIIGNMLSFADPERLRLETVDATELAGEAIASARGSIASGADATRWQITARIDAPPFTADRIKIRQALRNLVANALQAQPEGGAVAVELVQDGEHIALHVSDAGPGIPEHLRARVVDPFFTTRAEGTGLGLALVHTIAGLHGGSFEVCPHRSSCSHRDHAALGGAHMVMKIRFTPA